MAYVLVFLAFAFLIVLLWAIDWDRRIFFPLHGFGQHVRLGAILNTVIIAGVLSLLLHLSITQRADTGEMGDLLGAFTSWMTLLVTFSWLIPQSPWPYELQWGARIRTLDLRRICERWLYRFLLAWMAIEVIELLALTQHPDSRPRIPDMSSGTWATLDRPECLAAWFPADLPEHGHERFPTCFRYPPTNTAQGAPPWSPRHDPRRRLASATRLTH